MSNFYTLEHLFQECACDKGSLQLKSPVTEYAKLEILQESWVALNKWIEYRLSQRKGATVPMLGTFTWDFKRRNGTDVSFRPIFILADSFLKDHLVKRARIHKLPIVAPSEEINYSNIAIKYSKSLTKDMVFSGVRDIVKKIGKYFDRVYEFEIEFTFGVLKSKERRIKFEFNQSRITELLPQNLANTHLYMPEDYHFDDEPGEDDMGGTNMQSGFDTDRPGTSQTDMSRHSERYDTLSGPEAWQQTQFQHPQGKTTLKKSLSKSKFKATGLNSVRLEPISEIYGMNGARDTHSANPSYTQTFNQTNEFQSTDQGGKSFSAGATYPSQDPHSNAEIEGVPEECQGEEEIFMSPRLQELVLQIEAREQAARGIRKASNGRFAREKAVEDAYLRCLSAAEKTAMHNDSIAQAGADMVQTWTRRDLAKIDKARSDCKDLRATLDKQSVEARKRHELERIERRNAKMTFFLADNPDAASIQMEGEGKNATLEQRKERFCQDLGRQIKERAERKAKERHDQMLEERDYLDHIAVELDMQSAVERTAHLEKQQMLLEAWERDAHIRNLKGLELSGAPAVQSYIQHNLPDISQLRKKTLGTMGVGFDSRTIR